MLSSLVRASRRGEGMSSGALLAAAAAVSGAGAVAQYHWGGHSRYSHCHAKEEEAQGVEGRTREDEGGSDGTATPPEDFIAPAPIPAVAVFLDKGSVLKLKAHFPDALSDHLDRVVLQHSPDDSQYAMYSPLFGSKGGVKVLGQGKLELLAGGKEGQGVRPKDTKALYAEVSFKGDAESVKTEVVKVGEGGVQTSSSDDGGANAPSLSPAPPSLPAASPVESDTHVPTIVSSGGAAAGSEADRAVMTAAAVALMLRLKEEGALRQSSWTGPIPRMQFDDRCYPAGIASYTQVTPPIELQGVFCTEDGWDAEKQECTSEQRTECAFCRFMKAGPCREAFTAFERCIKGYDPKRAKNDEEKAAITQAMVAKCAPLAGALNYCMKEHAEYHAPVLDREEDEEKEHQARSAEEDKQEPKAG